LNPKLTDPARVLATPKNVEDTLGNVTWTDHNKYANAKINVNVWGVEYVEEMRASIFSSKMLNLMNRTVTVEEANGYKILAACASRVNKNLFMAVENDYTKHVNPLRKAEESLSVTAANTFSAWMYPPTPPQGAFDRLSKDWDLNRAEPSSETRAEYFKKLEGGLGNFLHG
jgi:hypothetical protein